MDKKDAQELIKDAQIFALNESKGDYTFAIKLMYDQLDIHWDDVQPLIIDKGIRAYLHEQAHTQRTPSPLRVPKPNAPRSVIVGKMPNLWGDILQTWFVGGRPLGDCTKDELLSEAEQHHKKARGHVVKAALYQRMATSMVGNQRVKDKYTAKDVEDMLRRPV